MATPLVKKLGIKPGQSILLLNGPEDYATKLEPLPDGVTLAATPNGDFDMVHLFVRTKADLDRDALLAIQSVRPGGTLWISYPKGNSKERHGLTRDVGWEAVFDAGMEGVMLISFDQVWSAERFSPKTREEEPDYVEAHYAGAKAALRPIYDRLTQMAQQLGPDVTLEPRKNYVALVRKRQFGLIFPSTRTRIDLGLKLPGVEPTERLQAAGGFGSGQITHRVGLTSVEDVDEEVVGWMKTAYEGIG
jgi:predicted transport protein